MKSIADKEKDDIEIDDDDIMVTEDDLNTLSKQNVNIYLSSKSLRLDDKT
jgi:hypothetical protein